MMLKCINMKKIKEIKPEPKKATVDDFIGVFDNFIPPGQCEDVIKMYQSEEKANKVYTRYTNERIEGFRKKDSSLDLQPAFHMLKDDIKDIIVNFDMALQQYFIATNIDAITNSRFGFKYTIMKIQKTLPGEGYHVWHTEWGEGMGMEGFTRWLVFSIYLNDVEDGGETEFLHFSKRVKPKRGRIVIWPAAFPYVHRGNPPLSGEKYILTSWLCLKQS